MAVQHYGKCDLPWNPARLEQRIACAWRKNQLRPVTVVNLVAENTIEHGMLASLSQKMGLAQGVLDGMGDRANIKLKSGGQAFLKRLDQVMSSVPTVRAPMSYTARPNGAATSQPSKSSMPRHGRRSKISLRPA